MGDRLIFSNTLALCVIVVVAVLPPKLPVIVHERDDYVLGFLATVIVRVFPEPDTVAQD